MARSKRELQEINAGSMADIAFLLLIFFLVTTTMDTDTGLLRRLPPPIPEDQEPPPPINERNVFVVLANAYDQLLVEGELLDPTDLRAKAKEFIIGYPNNQDDMRFPAFKPLEKLAPKDLKLVKKYLPGVKQLSKGVISLQNDKGTSYELYIIIQNELAAAYREVRDEASMANFGKSYGDLKVTNPDAAKAIKKVNAPKISEAEPKDVGPN
jgi:biopolymer transport protein ExbD